jgi:hypothetical protein
VEVKWTQIARAPRHICALAKNGLTHILSSNFLGPLAVRDLSWSAPWGEGYPSGVEHNSHRKALVTADQRLSSSIFVTANR